MTALFLVNTVSEARCVTCGDVQEGSALGCSSDSVKLQHILSFLWQIDGVQTLNVTNTPKEAFE